MSSGTYLLDDKRETLPREGYVGQSSNIEERFTGHQLSATLNDDAAAVHQWMRRIGIINVRCRILRDRLLTESARESAECEAYTFAIDQGWILYNERDPCTSAKGEALERLATGRGSWPTPKADQMLDEAFLHFLKQKKQ